MEQQTFSTRQVEGEAFLRGLCTIARHSGLVLLLFIVNLAAGLFLTTPLYRAFLSETGSSGFAEELSRGFDLILWVDFFGGLFDRLPGFRTAVLLAIPAAILWKIASTAGLIAALHAGRSGTFFSGMLRYTAGTLLLTAGYLPFAAAGLLLALIAIFGLSAVWPGEIGSFWLFGVTLPFLLGLCYTVIDLVQDYGRILYIAGGLRISAAWSRSVRWPFRHPASVTIYAIWLGIGTALLLIPLILDGQTVAASPWSIGLLFGLQQLILAVRSAVTIGWFGSELAYFERVRPVEFPDPPLPEENPHDSGLPPEDSKEGMS